MQDILAKAKRLKFADNQTIANVAPPLEEFEKYKALMEYTVPFISCWSAEKYETVNFINCFTTQQGMSFSAKNLTDMQDGLVADNAVFFSLPEITEREDLDEDILKISDETDAMLLITNMKDETLSFKEKNVLPLLRRSIENHPEILDKIIFIIYSEARTENEIQEAVDRRKSEICEIMGVDKLRFYMFTSSICFDGKKLFDIDLLTKSGMVPIRAELTMSEQYISGVHSEVFKHKKQNLEKSVNELLSQIASNLNTIYNVLSYGEGIQKQIENTIDYYRIKIQTFIREAMLPFDSMPSTEPITLSDAYSFPKNMQFKSEKLALAWAAEQLRDAYDARNGVAYTASVNVGQSIRAALNYANPDYHCFVRMTHVVTNTIAQCIEDLKNYHIILSKIRFASQIMFKQEKEFLDIIDRMDRNLYQYILPVGKENSLEGYLAQYPPKRVETGRSLFGTKYVYVYEDVGKIAEAMYADMNKNLEDNKQVIWNSITFVKRKFSEIFKEEIKNRMTELESAAMSVYNHPQKFKDLEFEKNNVVTTMRDIQVFLDVIHNS